MGVLAGAIAQLWVFGKEALQNQQFEHVFFSSPHEVYRIHLNFPLQIEHDWLVVWNIFMFP